MEEVSLNLPTTGLFAFEDRTIYYFSWINTAFEDCVSVPLLSLPFPLPLSLFDIPFALQLFQVDRGNVSVLLDILSRKRLLTLSQSLQSPVPVYLTAKTVSAFFLPLLVEAWVVVQ